MPNRSIAVAALVLSLAVTAPGAAAGPVFEGFDLAGFDFDVTSYDPVSASGLGGNAVASGTSNGIGWEIGPTSLWTGRTTTDGSFDFLNAGTNILGKSTDNLHASSDFTVTFDRTVASLIVALGNDGSGTDSVDFGLTPAAVQGLTVGASNSGTQILLVGGGEAGLALFTNIDSLTVTHTDTNVADGFDFAFHAQPVPAPASLALLLLGGGALVLRRRRR